MGTRSDAPTSLVAPTRQRYRRVAVTGCLLLVIPAVLAGCSGSSKPHRSATPSLTQLGPSPSSSTTHAAPGRASRTASKAVPNPALTDSSLPTQTTVAPVPLTSTGKFGDSVTGSIMKVRALNAKAKVPGEVSGPGLAVTIKLVNHSGKTLNLNNTVVNLAYGKNAAPGNPMSGPPSEPFPQTLADGKSATGVFVFVTGQQGQHGSITVQVSYSPLAPVVVFKGSA